MAETFIFSIGVPSAVESETHKINLYESIDGLQTFVLIDTVFIADLTALDNGDLVWRSEIANAEAYHQVKPVSIDGIERGEAAVLPPRPADLASCNIYVFVKDLGLVPKAGIIMAVRPKFPYRILGNLIDPDGITVSTDENGYASVPVPLGIDVEITIDKFNRHVKLNTADLVASAINFADLL